MAITQLNLRITNSIGEIASDAWDACANPEICGGGPSEHARRADSASGKNYNPFISHAFLHALECSDSVRARVGWQPMHLLASDAGGMLVGAAPCYMKSHSRGEYVFDHGWAEAYERAGGSYYP